MSGLALITAFALSQPTLSGAGPRNPNTDWFKESRYGVFMHLLPSNAESLALVDDFDLNAQLAQFIRERLREALNCPFGAVIQAHQREGDQPANRGHVKEQAGAVGSEMG